MSSDPTLVLRPQQQIGPRAVPFVSTFRIPAITAALAAIHLTTAAPARAGTEASLLIEADTGKVLHAENATVPWYPASTSKLMTVYVTLQAVKNHRISLDTLFTVTARPRRRRPPRSASRPGPRSPSTMR